MADAMDDTHQLFTAPEWSRLADILSLSPQQSRVVLALMDGLSDKEIAQRLQIKPPTVRMHLTRIFGKFNVQDRTELVIHVFRVFRSSNTS